MLAYSCCCYYISGEYVSPFAGLQLLLLLFHWGICSTVCWLTTAAAIILPGNMFHRLLAYSCCCYYITGEYVSPFAGLQLLLLLVHWRTCSIVCWLTVATAIENMLHRLFAYNSYYNHFTGEHAPPFAGLQLLLLSFHWRTCSTVCSFTTTTVIISHGGWWDCTDRAHVLFSGLMYNLFLEVAITGYQGYISSLCLASPSLLALCHAVNARGLWDIKHGLVQGLKRFCARDLKDERISGRH